jgi:formylglycine-generating enzyme required for sulfatase activity
LPTEAEWEYAARGAVLHDTFPYSGNEVLDVVAWFTDNSGNRTHAVATKKANSAGLWDMSGNIWEWCWDCYSKYNAEASTNPLGPEKGTYRVFRGGGWYGGGTRGCRVPYRSYDTPEFRSTSLGFRLVRPF